MFNAPLLAEVARAYIKLKQYGPAKAAAEEALALNDGCARLAAAFALPCLALPCLTIQQLGSA